MALQRSILLSGSSGAAFHPIYKHGGTKWILLSLPETDYHLTKLNSA